MRFLQPIWDGSFVYQEPICFSADKAEHCCISRRKSCQSHRLTEVFFTSGAGLYRQGAEAGAHENIAHPISGAERVL